MDSLPAIRNLKADGAAVYFDKEYIKKQTAQPSAFLHGAGEGN